MAGFPKIVRVSYDPSLHTLEATGVSSPIAAQLAQHHDHWTVAYVLPQSPEVLRPWDADRFRSVFTSWQKQHLLLRQQLSPEGKALYRSSRIEAIWHQFDGRDFDLEADRIVRKRPWSLAVAIGSNGLQKIEMAADHSLFSLGDLNELIFQLVTMWTDASPTSVPSIIKGPTPQAPRATLALNSVLGTLTRDVKNPGFSQSFKLTAKNEDFARSYPNQDVITCKAGLLACLLAQVAGSETGALLWERGEGRDYQIYYVPAFDTASFRQYFAQLECFTPKVHEGLLQRQFAALSLCDRALDLDVLHWPHSAPALIWMSSRADETQRLYIQPDSLPQILAENIVTILLDFIMTSLKEPDSSPGALRWPQLMQNLQDRWRSNVRAYPLERSLPELFATRFSQSADRPAIQHSHAKTMTFAELDHAAHNFAAHLQVQGIGPGDLVGLGLNREPWMVVALLGILRSGAGYVPLDPNFPKERLRTMLDDAKVKALVCEEELKGLVLRGSLFIAKDELIAASADPLCRSFQVVNIAPESIAYVIYTSGSTGQPKGVALSHRSVVNFLLSMQETPGMDESSMILAVTTLSFDIAVLEIMLPLLTGARLHLATADEVKDGKALKNLLETQPITHFQATPSAFRLLLDAGWKGSHLKVAMCGGEAFPGDVARRLRGFVAQIWNMYGPTETTVWSSVYAIAGGEELIPIGRPIANTSIYILDDNLAELLPGQKGEIYIGGTGLALGYFGRDDLTRERFLQFNGQRIYKTGDIGRYRWDGCIEIYGRADQQIKLRGYRMELGEIEAVIGSLQGIALCIADVKDFEADDPRLIAYVQVEGIWDERAVRQQLKDRLPHYMLPQHYVKLQNFVLLPNGKVNRKALPHPKHPVQTPGSIKDQAAAQLLARQLSHTSSYKAPTQVPEPRHQAHERPAGQDQAFLTLTPSQSRMLITEKTDPNTRVHNLLAAWTLNGDIDEQGLKRALEALIAEQDSLRMRIEDRGEESYLTIEDEVNAALQTHAVKNLDEAQDLLKAIAAKGLSIYQHPNFEIGLISHGKDAALLYLLTHHMFWDGFSYHVFWQSLHRHYQSVLSTGRTEIARPAFNYAQYAMDRAKASKSPELSAQLFFWKQQFQTLPDPLELGLDRPRPAELSHASSHAGFSIDRELDKSLQTFAKNTGFTLYHILLATYFVLLNRISRQADLVIGSPVHGRHRSETFDLLGNFINVIPIRMAFQGNLSFMAVLERIQVLTRDAMSNSLVPIEQIIALLKVPRDVSRTPLYSAMFFFQDQSSSRYQLGPLEAKPFPFDNQTVDTDLVLWVERYRDQCFAGINFRKDLWDQSTMDHMAAGFRSLLQNLLHDPRALLEKIPTLDPLTSAALLLSVNPITEKTYESVWHWIKANCAIYPDKPAVTSLDGGTLSYQELWYKSSAIATELSAIGVKAQDLVGVCLDRDLDLIPCLLAIFAVGGAYVPLDPLYPIDRLQYMAQDARCSHILCAFSYADNFSELGIPLFCIDQQRDAIALAEPFAGAHAKAEQIAYTIYTSGSTGKPKGVEIQHAALMVFLQSISQTLDLNAKMRTLAITTISFDISILEIFGTLANGGEVILVDQDSISDGKRLIKAIDDFAVNVLQATPATWRLLLESGWQGDPSIVGLCGGEALVRDLARKLVPRLLQLWNVYGPTEATVWATAARIVDAEAAITIGRPLPGYEVLILDESKHLLPPGAVGDLYIGGLALAKAYRFRPELTREKFIDHPFKAQHLLYDTGDLARFRSDGSIEYVSRRDNQVKLRGFRIELGEIEAAIMGLSDVLQAACLVREDRPGDKRLVAYVVFEAGRAYDLPNLHALLRVSLPTYMLPNFLVVMQKLPLTASGKIDRKALPPPEANPKEINTDSLASHSALNPFEQRIAQLFCDALGLASARACDNFFELGGHSLLALKVLHRMESDLGQRFKLKDLLMKTIAQLAADWQMHIEQKEKA